jgi:hypothetical protein
MGLLARIERGGAVNIEEFTPYFLRVACNAARKYFASAKTMKSYETLFADSIPVDDGVDKLGRKLDLVTLFTRPPVETLAHRCDAETSRKHCDDNKEVKEVLKTITSRHGKYSLGYTFYTTLYRNTLKWLRTYKRQGLKLV